MYAKEINFESLRRQFGRFLVKNSALKRRDVYETFQSLKNQELKNYGFEEARWLFQVIHFRVDRDTRGQVGLEVKLFIWTEIFASRPDSPRVSHNPPCGRFFDSTLTHKFNMAGVNDYFGDYCFASENCQFNVVAITKPLFHSLTPSERQRLASEPDNHDS